MNEFIMEPWYVYANQLGYTIWDIKDKNYVLNVSVPGIKKEDLSIKVKKDIIGILGKGVFGETEYSYYLPDDCKVKNLEAKLENGVLTLSVPKEDTEVKIEIQ